MKLATCWQALLLGFLVGTSGACIADTPHALAQRPGHAGIASANALATQAGFAMLAKGGNAFDAAIAIASVLSVVEPESSGLGGGFIATLHVAADGRTVSIDARETAPAAVDARDYLHADGTPNRDTALRGPLSAGIPGEPAGLAWLARHYGKLPLSASLAPAIGIAREGFKPDDRLFGAIEKEQKDLKRWPASAKKFLPGGKPPAVGHMWRDPDQAHTLELLANYGEEGFYSGENARKLVDAVRTAGGNWTLQDLASYRVKERAPIIIDYRGYRIFTAALPSAGGVTMAEMLHMLAGFDLSHLDTAHRTHLMIEAMRRAFRDHNAYLGDPDFVKIPLDMLLSPYYTDGLRQSILPDKATPSSMLAPSDGADAGLHTTHFSIIDADGNMVSMTCTVNDLLGSTFVAEGTGVLLNDEMDDFALVPNQPNDYGLLGGKANAPAPGKRMLSAMTPSLVIGPERTAVIGSPGGSTIITQVLEGILAFIDGAGAHQVVAKKRFHHQYMPDVVMVEPGAFDTATTDALAKMGYTFRQRAPWGFMNMVIWDRRTNKLDAASDPRRSGGLGKVQ